MKSKEVRAALIEITARAEQKSYTQANQRAVPVGAIQERLDIHLASQCLWVTTAADERNSPDEIRFCLKKAHEYDHVIKLLQYLLLQAK